MEQRMVEWEQQHDGTPRRMPSIVEAERAEARARIEAEVLQELHADMIRQKYYPEFQRAHALAADVEAKLLVVAFDFGWADEHGVQWYKLAAGDGRVRAIASCILNRVSDVEFEKSRLDILNQFSQQGLYQWVRHGSVLTVTMSNTNHEHKRMMVFKRVMCDPER